MPEHQDNRERTFNLRIIKTPLPGSVKEAAAVIPGGYMVMINESLPEPNQAAAFVHAMLHIWHNDFDAAQPVQQLETERHRETDEILKGG